MPDATDRSAVFPPEMTADRRRFLALLREKSYERRKVVLSSEGNPTSTSTASRARSTRRGGPHGALFCAMLERGERPEAVGGITLGRIRS